MVVFVEANFAVASENRRGTEGVVPVVPVMVGEGFVELPRVELVSNLVFTPGIQQT